MGIVGIMLVHGVLGIRFGSALWSSEYHSTMLRGRLRYAFGGCAVQKKRHRNVRGLKDLRG